MTDDQRNLSALPPRRTDVWLVRWLDSSLQNGQVDASDAPEPEVITSVGFLMKEEEDYVVIARDDHGDRQWRGLCAIPRIAIQEMQRA